jgi:hypothetical protein
MNGKTIETKRLQIRPYVLADFPVIHRILDQTFGQGDKVNDESALGSLCLYHWGSARFRAFPNPCRRSSGPHEVFHASALIGMSFHWRFNLDIAQHVNPQTSPSTVDGPSQPPEPAFD